jgi:hypothetical protein
MELKRSVVKLLLTTLFLLSGICSFAQFNRDWSYSYADLKDDAKENLYFRFEGNSFMKNNEYYSEFIQGYTLIGYSVQPSLMYYVNSKLRLKAGVHLLKYDGVSEFTEVMPVYSAHVVLSEHLDMIIGSLKGDVQHKLIDPIFDPENQYTRPVESGLQFLFSNKNLRADIWVDWDQFIFDGDTIPEKFTSGLSSEFILNKPQAAIDVSIPLQMIVRHVGGQISNYSQESTTEVNVVTGVKLERKLDDGFIRSAAFSSYIAFYKDLSGSAGYEFTSGTAFYPVMNLTYKYGEFMTGYWYAKNFIAPQGSSIFQSVSSRDDNYYQKKRHLLNTKFSYVKNIGKQAKFTAMIESYYDLDSYSLDYVYGVYLMFTPNFFIKNISFD